MYCKVIKAKEYIRLGLKAAERGDNKSIIVGAYMQKAYDILVRAINENKKGNK